MEPPELAQTTPETDPAGPTVRLIEHKFEKHHGAVTAAEGHDELELFPGRYAAGMTITRFYDEGDNCDAIAIKYKTSPDGETKNLLIDSADSVIDQASGRPLSTLQKALLLTRIYRGRPESHWSPTPEPQT